MNSIRTILFPTDFSEASYQAFPYAAALAKAFGATLIMMHVEGSGEGDGRVAAGLEEKALEFRKTREIYIPATK